VAAEPPGCAGGRYALADTRVGVAARDTPPRGDRREGSPGVTRPASGGVGQAE